MKKSLKSIIVLSSICLILAALLAGVNALTAPVIAENEARAAEEALREVYPSGESFEKLSLDALGSLPASVIDVQRANDGGYVITAVTKGHKSGLTVMCGISPDGVVTGAVCLASGETYGEEKTYGKNFIGKNSDTVNEVDTVSGITKTTQAYKTAIKDALDAFNSISGIGGENNG